MTDSMSGSTNILPWKIQQYCLQNSDNTVGATNSLIRSRLSKESLQQRLVEIAQEIAYYDNQLDELFENKSHTSHQDTLNKLQDSWDSLTGESDEIENLLKNKYGMKGGGRLQMDQEQIIAAMEIGAQFGSKEQFSQDSNSKNTNHQCDNSDIMSDEEVNSDIDSEQDIEFDYDSNKSDMEQSLQTQTLARNNKGSIQTQAETVRDNKEEMIYELNVHRKVKQTIENKETSVECEKETRDQKFRRLEKNWSKNRRYMDPFKGDGLLSKLGEFYEKQNEERKKKRRKGRKAKKKLKKVSVTPQPQKGEEFCYKLGSVKIHIENEHLDGVKPEDLRPFIPANRVKKVSATQFTYHLPVVLEYFKIVTDIPRSKSNKRKHKKRRNKAVRHTRTRSVPLEGFKLYYVNGDSYNKIYLGCIKHSYLSDSILSLLIQLSQNCGAVTHRCQIILEQQYVTAQEEDSIEETVIVEEKNAIENGLQTVETEESIQEMNESDVEYQRATKEKDAAAIVVSLLEKYPALVQWLSNKPNYHSAVQTNNRHGLSLLNKLVSSQTEWKNVITQLIGGINEERKQSAIEQIRLRKQNTNSKVVSTPVTSEMDVSVSENEKESETSKEESEDYIGSDEFVSGLLIVTVYLSRAVFVRRNILKAIRHIKAFDALLDLLKDSDEVLGVTESFPLPINDKQTHKQNINQFDTGLLYEKLKPKWTKQMTMSARQPKGMVCILWDYQRKAVSWMLKRELEREMVPNLLWRQFECQYQDINDVKNNKTHQFWYHIDEGRFWDNEIPKLLDVRGGILADQMGLGKTVECLALINLHKQKYWSLGKPVQSKCIILDEDEGDSKDKCIEPDAEALEQYELKQELLCESAATLIVTPTNILHQWKNEIMKHSPELKVYIYLGMKQWKKETQRLKRKRKHKTKRKLSSVFDGISAVSQPRKRRRLGTNRSESINFENIVDNMPVNEDEEEEWNEEEPNYRNLGKYDIVLTDYNVLKAESDYSNPLKYTFRRKKRHEIPDTPLLQIRWWRLILDEAQQIESKVSKCAQMALKVTTKHKWCVTGTPIGKNGLDDLYGLIKFLGIKPFNSQIAWLRTVAEPYYNGDDRRLFHILKRIMWRQAKHHVSKELNIPPRKEEFIELTFCGVEHEYYKKLHDEFTENLKHESINKYNTITFNARMSKNKQKLMVTQGGIKSQLEILRQACCHPQISRQTFLNTTNRNNGGIMTMKQIMGKMIEDANDRMTADERELSRAGTYYSDWLIYRVTHKLFDDASNSDAELELYLQAIKVLEEVFKVEQSGIDNIEKECILKGVDDDSIKCDNFDMSNLPVIEPVKPLPPVVNDDDKLQMMIEDMNEGSPGQESVKLKMSLSVTPTPQRVYINHSDMRPKRKRTNKLVSMTVESESDYDSDEDYVPPGLNGDINTHYMFEDLPQFECDNEEEFVVESVTKNETEMKANSNGSVLVLPSLESAESAPIQIDLNLCNDVNEEMDVRMKNKFEFCSRSSMQSLLKLKINDKIGVYLFNEWQPCMVIGKGMREIIVHFTHFDARGKDMDHLLPLDTEIICIEYYKHALKSAEMRQDLKVQKTTNETMVSEIMNEDIDHKVSEDTKNESVNDQRYKYTNLVTANEKYYSWKKCEIATAHHLKYLYQRLSEKPHKFHLSQRDMDILSKKLTVMELSLIDCKLELQEQSEMKVSQSKAVILGYEQQIDQWAKDLQIREINDLVKLRSKIPIKQWQKKQFNRVHNAYHKYIIQKEDIQRKLQYACFKLRSMNVRQKLSDWIPNFCSIWDKINEEFRTKENITFKPRHSFTQYITNSLQNFERRMHEINRLHRECADSVNSSNIALEEQVSFYRSKWNDLMDITTLFRVFGQISEDHKRLKKYEEELKVNEEKIQTHCAIVDDFDIARWTVIGIEDHLRNRYNTWKQKALGKAQQLRYLRQKHSILINAGCRVTQECSICKLEIRNPTLTQCGHLFCETCILAWLKSVNFRSNSGKACPQCRHRINESDIFHVSEYLTQSNSSYIHASIESVFNDKQKLSADKVEQKSENPKCEMDCDESDSEEGKDDLKMDKNSMELTGIKHGSYIDNIDIVGKGDYGTKIESLVKYIKYLSATQPNAKSLVYSQFSQLLAIIAAILNDNGIQVIHQNSNQVLSRRDRAKRIENFQTDPSVKVLLLSLRTDSSGLTLIQATHVFLLEPSLNEAIELQAIDRVHRVGQTKHTFVHRYFMKGTVEENILRQRYEKKLLNGKKNKLALVRQSSVDSGLDKGQNTEEMTIEELMKLFGSNS